MVDTLAHQQLKTAAKRRLPFPILPRKNAIEISGLFSPKKRIQAMSTAVPLGVCAAQGLVEMITYVII
jgi:hypothetical protein